MSYGSRVKLEDKVLHFEFNFQQVQFNKNGKYFLRFTVQNFHREDLLSMVYLEENNSGQVAAYRPVSTEVITWDGSSQSVTFNLKSLRYLFPKGFCKNDNNYDVNLTIEALALEQAGRKFKQPNKVGEAKFAIYPRTDAPRANLLVDRGENYYKYAGIITLLRPFTKSSISMHCGRISYSVAFREDVEATDIADQNGEIQAKPMPKPRNTSRKKTETPPKQPPSPEVTEDFKDDDVSETLSDRESTIPFSSFSQDEQDVLKLKDKTCHVQSIQYQPTEYFLDRLKNFIVNYFGENTLHYLAENDMKNLEIQNKDTNLALEYSCRPNDIFSEEDNNLKSCSSTKSKERSNFSKNKNSLNKSFAKKVYKASDTSLNSLNRFSTMGEIKSKSSLTITYKSESNLGSNDSKSATSLKSDYKSFLSSKIKQKNNVNSVLRCSETTLENSQSDLNSTFSGSDKVINTSYSDLIDNSSNKSYDELSTNNSLSENDVINKQKENELAGSKVYDSINNSIKSSDGILNEQNAPTEGRKKFSIMKNISQMKDLENRLIAVSKKPKKVVFRKNVSFTDIESINKIPQNNSSNLRSRSLNFTSSKTGSQVNFDEDEEEAVDLSDDNGNEIPVPDGVFGIKSKHPPKVKNSNGSVSSSNDTKSSKSSKRHWFKRDKSAPANNGVSHEDLKSSETSLVSAKSGRIHWFGKDKSAPANNVVPHEDVKSSETSLASAKSVKSITKYSEDDHEFVQSLTHIFMPSSKIEDEDLGPNEVLKRRMASIMTKPINEDGTSIHNTRSSASTFLPPFTNSNGNPSTAPPKVTVFDPKVSSLVFESYNGKRHTVPGESKKSSLVNKRRSLPASYNINAKPPSNKIGEKINFKTNYDGKRHTVPAVSENPSPDNKRRSLPASYKINAKYPSKKVAEKINFKTNYDGKRHTVPAVSENPSPDNKRRSLPASYKINAKYPSKKVAEKINFKTNYDGKRHTVPAVSEKPSPDSKRRSLPASYYNNVSYSSDESVEQQSLGEVVSAKLRETLTSNGIKRNSLDAPEEKIRLSSLEPPEGDIITQELLHNSLVSLIELIDEYTGRRASTAQVDQNDNNDELVRVVRRSRAENEELNNKFENDANYNAKNDRKSSTKENSVPKKISQVNEELPTPSYNRESTKTEYIRNSIKKSKVSKEEPFEDKYDTKHFSLSKPKKEKSFLREESSEFSFGEREESQTSVEISVDSYSEQSVVVKVSSSTFKQTRKRKSTSKSDDETLKNSDKIVENTSAESAPVIKRRKLDKTINSLQKPPWNSSTNLQSLSALSKSSLMLKKPDRITKNFEKKAQKMNKDTKYKPNLKIVPEKDTNLVETKKDYLKKKPPPVPKSDIKKDAVVENQQKPNPQNKLPQRFNTTSDKNADKAKTKSKEEAKSEKVKETSSQHSLKIKVAINNQKPRKSTERKSLENNKRPSRNTVQLNDDKPNIVSNKVDVDVLSKVQKNSSPETANTSLRETSVKAQIQSTNSNKSDVNHVKTNSSEPKQKVTNFNMPNKKVDTNKTEFKANVQVNQKQTENLNKNKSETKVGVSLATKNTRKSQNLNKNNSETKVGVSLATKNTRKSQNLNKNKSETKVGVSLATKNTRKSQEIQGQRKLKFDFKNIEKNSKTKSESSVEIKSTILNRLNSQNKAKQRTENFKFDVGVFADADKQTEKYPEKTETSPVPKPTFITQDPKFNQISTSTSDTEPQFKTHKTQTNRRGIDVTNFYHPYQRLALRKENLDFVGLIDQIRADLRRSLKFIRQQKNPSDQIRMFKELISKYIPTENEIPTQTSEIDAIGLLSLEEGLSTTVNLPTNNPKSFPDESIRAMTKILESFQKSNPKDNKMLSSLHPVLTSRGLELMPIEDGTSNIGPKRPVPFEGSYDILTKKYEPVLMSSPIKFQKKHHTYRIDPYEVKFNFLPNREEQVLSSYRPNKRRLKPSSSSFRKFFRENHRRVATVRQNKTSLKREEAKLRELASIRLKEQQYESYLNEKNKAHSYTPATKLPPIHDDEMKRRDNLSAVERNPILGFLGENTLKNTSTIRPIIERACDMTESEEHMLKHKELSKSIRKETRTQ